MDILKEAKKVFEIEIQALSEASESLDENFIRLVDDIYTSKGRVFIVGIGKSSHVGAKVAATITSLGTPAFFLHPADSLHGDLGRITSSDIVLFFSKSGESEEVNQMLLPIKKIGAKTVAVTCRQSSTLSRGCDYFIVLNIKQEASVYDIAPTSTTTAMMALGDALAVCLERISGFTLNNFALFHPGGALGKRLLITIADIMLTGDDVPYIFETANIKDALLQMSSKSIVGGVAVVDRTMKLLGIFTDGDLRRLFDDIGDISALEQNITEVMTINPITLTGSDKAADALPYMTNPQKPIKILPIVDESGKLTGMLSVHDLIRVGL